MALPSTADTAVAERFLGRYADHDWEGLGALMAPDVEWSLPGDAVISGRAIGVEAVLDRVRCIVGRGVRTELLHVVTGQDAVALLLRNTADGGDGPGLDETLVTLLRPEDGLVRRIETYLSDVPGMIAFFGPATE